MNAGGPARQQTARVPYISSGGPRQEPSAVTGPPPRLGDSLALTEHRRASARRWGSQGHRSRSAGLRPAAARAAAQVLQPGFGAGQGRGSRGKTVNGSRSRCAGPVGRFKRRDPAVLACLCGSC